MVESVVNRINDLETVCVVYWMVSYSPVLSSNHSLLFSCLGPATDKGSQPLPAAGNCPRYRYLEHQGIIPGNIAIAASLVPPHKHSGAS